MASWEWKEQAFLDNYYTQEIQPGVVVKVVDVSDSNYCIAKVVRGPRTGHTINIPWLSMEAGHWQKLEGFEE